jgi:hypothetical protein
MRVSKLKLNKVIVLIVAHQEFVSQEQEKSILRCYEIFNGLNIQFICPEGLNVREYKKLVPDTKVDFIDPIWQRTYFNFNRLKIEKFLYDRYQHYEYILFYEPDAYVFRNDLDSWIAKGYHNIGAPWFSIKTGELEANSGNGGFCLRNVGAALETLESNTMLFLPALVWNMVKELPFRYWWKYKFILIRLLFPVFQRSQKFIARYPFYEDKFWAKIAPVINKDFKVCPGKEALKFAFDAHPGKMYEMNDRQLPMGAHGWFRKERISFWKEHIEEVKEEEQ